MMSVTTRLKPVVNTLNRASGWLLLLAIGWLCWTAARLLWLLLAAPVAPELPLLPLQDTTGSSTDNSSLFAIFADPDPIAAAVLPPPNVGLKGVLLATLESLSSALLDVDGEVKNYRIGDSLKDSGYTLIAVDWNAVIIADAADKQTVIRMADALLLDQSDKTLGAVSNQRLPDNNMLPAAPTLDNNTNSAADTANESNPQSAIGEAVTALQENPASYLSRMGVMASGDGYQVTAAMPAGLRNRLGLEPGDRVMTVNGQSVGNNPGQDASVLQQIQQAGEAQIEVQRGEQVITIRQQF
ncbi:type II secretion system protein N [Psychrobacter sp. LV10R520-6]|uniref:type II secretion system protein N n=1 Tax=Psychrobacter sp. LV10R520-6 TaxID=1415574 RepID=UPI0024CB8A09|nr:type II secretion system protein N [Psychrobacter sp. LV10R520-6]SNT70491.1 general secretion pathway protein C [Psychrobacter sp. LV10R520-6]